MTVTYTVGDTREVIKGIADGSVDFICTSPPFLALRSYVPADHESKGDEIGSERNPAEFIDMLLGLTAEWGRVLAPHGSIAIELGDTYAASPNQRKPDNDGALDKSRWLRGERDDGVARPASGSGPGWPRAKSLALIPQLYAVALAYGINPLTGAPSPAGRWLVRNVIVWHRPNPAVGALGDKVRPSTSYIVIATRSPRRWFDLTAVRTPPKAPPQRFFSHGYDRGGNGATNDRPPVLEPGNRCDPAGAPPLDAWFDHYDSDLAEATSYDGIHDTWTLTTQPSRLAHYAMWPAKLAERLILSMCPREVCRVCGEPRRRVEGAAEYTDANGHDRSSDAASWASSGGNGNRGKNDGRTDGGVIRLAPTLGWTDCDCSLPVELDRWTTTAEFDALKYRPGLVLDPFAGSGTTLAVADLHGRDAIGIDFDARNKAIYPARYDEVKRALFGTPAPTPGQETFDFEEVAG